MLSQAKIRARKFDLPFDLVLSDIVIPEVCPVLGIPLKRRFGGRLPNSPSLDRMKPELGYVKGNVAIISWRANHIKNDARPEELRAVAEWVTQHEEESPTPDLE